jgi:hypothetical protein
MPRNNCCLAGCHRLRIMTTWIMTKLHHIPTRLSVRMNIGNLLAGRDMVSQFDGTLDLDAGGLYLHKVRWKF